MTQTFTLHRCEFTWCDWSFYEIDGSVPSKAIYDIAHSGHLHDVHDDRQPIFPRHDEYPLWSMFGPRP